MSKRVHQYFGDAINVQWDAQRCIHAAECLRRLGVVFDTRRVPWVLPDAATADEIAETIGYCPTGALHFTRHDGGLEETADDVNTVKLRVNGPLFVRGDIVLTEEDDEIVLHDTRIALCRCGASQHKPFCDNSHLAIGFQHDGTLGVNKLQIDADLPLQADTLKIVLAENGPLQLRGPVEIHGRDRRISYTGNTADLCRCGRSSNKPFCDSTHERIGFRSN